MQPVPRAPTALATPRFDMRGTDPARRSRAWADVLNEQIWSIDTDFPRDVRVGEYRGVAADRLRIATITTDPLHVERRASHLARDATDAYFLVFPTGGDIVIGQRGREVKVRAGTFTFVSGVEPSSYSQGETETFHSVVVPGAMVRDRKPDADDYLGGDFRGSSLQPVFADFASSFCRHAADLEGEALLGARDGLLDMLALTLERTDLGSTESAVKAMHRRRIVQFVERHFRSPEIGLASIAGALGLSPRYVQQILGHRGETVSDLVRGRRLAEACRLLDRRGASRASVASIAYAVGYPDPAHFSRVFRRAMGLSPTDYAARRG